MHTNKLLLARLHSISDLFHASNEPPKEAGVYAWYFDCVLPLVPLVGCLQRGPFTLLYVGIAPKRPSSTGLTSRATLRSRLRQHVAGTAEGSTLRLSLGCLLADELNLRLVAMGRSGRLTFGADGEARLSVWMSAHARVSFIAAPAPWNLERHILSETSLPLNLLGNDSHAFFATLGSIRSEARSRARAEWLRGREGM